tara:strand:+ start:745 stop:1239 length:495 start_codon:yes stop_codon:yes gene_type:complete
MKAKTNIRKIVIESLEKNGDNPKRATQWLVTKSKKSADLKDSLLMNGANQLVRDYFGSQRINAMSMASARVLLGGDSKRLSNRLARFKFWDSYTLFGMQPIKSATREMLLDSSNNRTTQARGEILLAKFEKAVSLKLKNNKVKVSQAITNEQLERIAVRFKVES